MRIAAALGCDGLALVAPDPSAEGLRLGGPGPVSVRIVDTRAGDGMVAVYWASGKPRQFDLVVDPPPPPPPVARTRLFVSDQGPEEGFRLVEERADSGLDTTLVGPLTNGVTYYFRAAVYDHADSLFGITAPVMTTPGSIVESTLRVSAPQADEPIWLSNLSWSPDSRELAVIQAASGGRPDIQIFNTVTRRFRPVTSFSSQGGSYRLMSVDWSRDGRFLAFGYTAGATYGDIDYRIWRVGVDGSGLQVLSSGRVDGDAVWVTPEELVFTKGRYVAPGSPDGRNVPELYRLVLEPSPREMAVTSGDSLYKYHLAYSPRTDQIAFSGVAAERSLYLIPRAGGELERLTDRWAPPFFGDIHPAWTPDARAILFASNRSGHYEIWSLDLATREIRQVTRGLEPGVERFAPRPSPDGTRLAFLELRRTDHSSDAPWRYQLVLQPLAR